VSSQTTITFKLDSLLKVAACVIIGGYLRSNFLAVTRIFTGDHLKNNFLGIIKYGKI